MALQVHFATATVDLVLDTRQFYRELARAAAAMARFQSTFTVTLNVNAAPAHARLNLVLQQLLTLQRQATIRLGAGGGGFWVGGGRGGGPGFLSGFGMGLGLPYTGNPQMMGGLLLGRGLSGAVSNAVDLQSKFAVLGRVTGFGADQMARMKREIFSIAEAPQTAASLDDIIEIATVGGRQGMGAQGTEGLTQFTAALTRIKTVITDIPAEELANRMARIMFQFKLGSEQAEGFGSAIVDLDNRTTASAEDILDVTQRLSGGAAAAHMSLPETMALAATGKQAGLSNEVAGTHIGQLIQRMASGREKFAASLGMDKGEFAAAYRRSPIEALGMVVHQLAGMSDDAIATADALKGLDMQGARARGSLQQLAAVFPQVAQHTEAANEQFRSLAAIGGGVERSADLVKSAMERLSSSFKDFGNSIGEPLLGPLAALIDKLAELPQGAKAGVVGLPGGVGSGGATVGGTINAIKSLIPEATGTDPMFGALGRVIGGPARALFGGAVGGFFGESKEMQLFPGERPVPNLKALPPLLPPTNPGVLATLGATGVFGGAMGGAGIAGALMHAGVVGGAALGMPAVPEPAARNVPQIVSQTMGQFMALVTKGVRAAHGDPYSGLVGLAGHAEREQEEELRRKHQRLSRMGFGETVDAASLSSKIQADLFKAVAEDKNAEKTAMATAKSEAHLNDIKQKLAAGIKVIGAAVLGP